MRHWAAQLTRIRLLHRFALFYGRFGPKNAGSQTAENGVAGLREPERGCVVLGSLQRVGSLRAFPGSTGGAAAGLRHTIKFLL